MKRSLIPCVFTALLILSACETPPVLTGGGKEYECAHVSKSNIAGIIEESGDIASNDEYTYFAAITAPISSISIEKGDSVHIGDKLVTYDTTDYEHNVMQAELQSKQSEDSAKGQITKSNNYSAKYNQAVAEDQAYAVLYYISRENSNGITETQYTDDYQMQCEIDGLNKEIAKVSEEITNLNGEITKLSNEPNVDLDKISQKENEIADKNSRIAELKARLASVYPMQYTPEENMMLNDISNTMEDITRNWTQAKT
ncbi:MAG: hypothetical protein K6G22_01235, partial [Lachnospiraceae bacterium]|nr:hypothetical protein [Lachnospiraceae bacterium]